MPKNKIDVCVIGLGYVGLTLATVLAEVGFRVVGIENRLDVVSKTNLGEPHFAEVGLKEAMERVVSNGKFRATDSLATEVACDTYIITVGTPLNEDGAARLDMIEAASKQVADHMENGALVILRSTVKIGTARNVVRPILEASGKVFELAMCPERTLEGKALQELRELPQIVGADTQETRDRAAAVFRKLTSTVVQVARLETAEVIKLVDNTFRDVQFAFANEVARLCDAFGVNAQEVIASGKLGYKRTNVPMPGLVGGPCLEKDPHILFQSGRSKGIDLEITLAGRIVNERQPFETARFIASEMRSRGHGEDCVIALLGIAFKGIPETDDLRGSMSLKVLDALRQEVPNAKIRLYDPVIRSEVLEKNISGCKAYDSLEQAVENVSVVIIANNHPQLGLYQPLDLSRKMKPKGFVYDYWNHFSNLTESELGGLYFGVGNIGRAV